MNRLNEIKVFHPGSKKADFTIRSPTVEGATKKLGELVNDGAEEKAVMAFRSLSEMKGEALTFKAAQRRIKVLIAA